MNEMELRSVLREHGGWSLSRKKRRKQFYLYAVRRIRGGGRQEVYIGPERTLPQVQEADIVAKLST